MEAKQFLHIVRTSQKAAHLLGQVHGNIYGLIKKASTEDVSDELVKLFDYISQEVGNLYYKNESDYENSTN